MKSPARKTVRTWLLSITLVFCVYFLVQAYQGRDAPQSGLAPDIKALDINGQQVELAHYRGKPTLVYFWATWCKVCSLTRESINSIAQDHPVITIASQSGERSGVLAYQQKHEFEVSIINDENGRLGQAYGVRAFPTVFILDAMGNISDVEVGLSSEWGLRLRLWWAGW